MTATAVDEGVPGAGGAAGPGTEVDDSGGSETPHPVRPDPRALGVSSPAGPARHAGGEPTARDGSGSGAVPAPTRSCGSTDGARQLKKSHRVLCQGAAARYALRRTRRPPYPWRLLCRVLAVSRSGDEAWRTRRPSTRAQENARLAGAIQAAPVRTRQTYGPDRLQAERREDGFPAGIGRLKRLRKKRGLRGTPVRRFTPTTDAPPARPVAAHVLAQPVAARRPTEPWGTDMTSGPTVAGGR